MNIIYTNKKGFPEYVVDFLKRDDYDYDPNPNRISATTLMSPSRPYVLLENYKGDIKIDVENRIALQFGNCMHAGFEATVSKGTVLQEERLETDIQILNQTITITGKPDMIHKGIIVDMKTTSVWKWMFGEIDDYVNQMSIYRYLAIKNNISVNNYGNIWYIFTDWKKSESKYNKDYPGCRMKIERYDFMNDEETYNFIVDNAIRLKTASALYQSEGIAPECTDEDLWKAPDKWALKKEGNKKASKVYSDKEEAYSALKYGYIIEHRPSKAKRCNYCNARNICTQYADMLEKDQVETN